MESIDLRLLLIRTDASLSKIPTVIGHRNLTLGVLGVAAEPEAHMVGDKRADMSVAMPGRKILVELQSIGRQGDAG